VMFFLSRVVVELLVPLNLCIVLLFITLFLLWFKKVVAGFFSLTTALIILLLSGYGLWSTDYFIAQEETYPALTDHKIRTLNSTKIKYIVVLGSGHVSDKRLPVTSQIGGSSLFRLVEGIRLMNYFPSARLIISGGIGHDPVPNGDVVAQVAEILGVVPGKILLETRPRDTMQEAELLYPVLGKDTFILVTSALHMDRAMAIFIQYGMQPIPAPTDYIIKKHINKPPGSYLPSTRNLDLTKRMIYEWVGMLWMKIKIRFVS